MHDEPLSTALTTIIRAVLIDDAESYTFAGQAVSDAELWANQLELGRSPRERLVAHLGRQLYSHAYCRTFKGSIAEETSPADENVTEALSRANTSRERWDRGWTIDQVLPSGQVLARKGDATLELWGGEYTTHDGPGTRPRAGKALNVFVPKEALHVQPMFYFAFDETLVGQEGASTLVRFYWNVEPTAAPRLLGLLTSTLNRFQVPFRLKCANRRTELERLDALVLYVHARYYRVTSEILLDLYPPVAQDLAADTPLFTKRLRPGLAFAEDPGNGESFGTHRCRVLAEGIWRAFEHHAKTEEDQFSEVAREFEARGIALERPYLNRGSEDDYDRPWDSLSVPAVVG